MPQLTVAEILKASGMTDEQIAALDSKATEGFTKVLSTASQAQEAAERALRSQQQAYDTEIAPALANWANEKAAQDTRIAAYDAALKAAKEGGFTVPPILDTPNPNPNPNSGRDPNGKFVANANPVPGSPQYMTKEEGYRAVTSAQWFVSEYMRLHNGAPPPEDMEVLASEAQAQRIPFRDYVAKKYDFAAKREAIKAAEQKKHDDAIRAEEREKTTKEITERMGSNPNVRQAEASVFSTIEKAVKEGNRPDPLKMTREQRHAATGKQIRQEIAANESSTVH